LIQDSDEIFDPGARSKEILNPGQKTEEEKSKRTLK
jgi:hypothetical protein